MLFVPARTLDYWQGWAFAVVFFTCAASVTVYLWKHDPSLLERRIHAGPRAETEPQQKIIQALAGLAFLGLLLVPAFDRRFSWSYVPPAMAIAADAVVGLGFWLVFLVLRANTYAASTIVVTDGQHVVSSGPYAIVRHPLYAGALVMLTATPPALGSWWGLLMLVPMTLVLAWRLLDEERFLTQHLPGYADYCRTVRYRLLPFLW